MYNCWLSLLGIFFRYALENEQISVDPTYGIRRVKERGEGSRTSSEEEIAQYEAFLPVGSRLPAPGNGLRLRLCSIPGSADRMR